MQQAYKTAFVEGVDVNDTTLLQQLRDGEQAAFATLVRRHTTRFYRVAYRFMNNTAEAEDIVQDAFLKLWERPDSWNPEGGSAFTTWFHRVVVNQCLDRKKRKQAIALPDEMPVADERESQEEALMGLQQQRRMAAEIAALPERQRTALNLCFYEGLSNQEAADIMGLRLKALQSLLMRAKMTLKQKLVDEKGG